MSSLDQRIHFYHDGHTYEIEPASLNHNYAWFNATSLLHGANDSGEVLKRIYDYTIPFAKAYWQPFKSLATGTPSGDLLLFEALAPTKTAGEAVVLRDETVENPDGSTTVYYEERIDYLDDVDGSTRGYTKTSTTDTTFADDTTESTEVVENVDYTYDSYGRLLTKGDQTTTTTFSDDSSQSTAIYLTLYSDGTMTISTTETTTTAEGDTTTTTQSTEFPGGATIDFPLLSDHLFKFDGVVEESIISNISSYLANIGSSAENTAIYNSGKQVLKFAPAAPDGGGARYLWLGAADDSSFNWYWTSYDIAISNVHYAPMAGAFSNWGAGIGGQEPDNPGIQGGMAMGLEAWSSDGGGIGQAGQWNNVDQNNLLYSVIEWDGLIGTDLNDKFVGTAGDDVVHAGDGNDEVRAYDGNNIVYAGEGDDKIYTGAGNDIVIGGAGNDYIETGAGIDIIIPGAGSTDLATQKVKGGSGTDIFVVDEATGENYYKVLDFDSREDFLVLDKEAFTIFEQAAEESGFSEPMILGNFFLKGPGIKTPSTNETGIDDYLIFDTKSGNLYYDEDGYDSGAPVLIVTLAGYIATFDVQNIALV